MLLDKAIIININNNGNTAVKVTGAKGGECLRMTKKLEEKLGDVKNVKLTDDYYAALEAQQAKEQI